VQKWESAKVGKCKSGKEQKWERAKVGNRKSEESVDVGIKNYLGLLRKITNYSFYLAIGLFLRYRMKLAMDFDNVTASFFNC
jgi:hypothetical protein